MALFHSPTTFFPSLSRRYWYISAPHDCGPIRRYTADTILPHHGEAVLPYDLLVYFLRCLLSLSLLTPLLEIHMAPGVYSLLVLSCLPVISHLSIIVFGYILYYYM